MWRFSSKVFTRLAPAVSSIFPFSMYRSGPVDVPHYKFKEPEPDPNETGWTRLKKVFQVDEFGVMSDEMVMSLQATYTGCFIGVLYGGILSGGDAYHSFMRNNIETIFQNHFEAKKKLQDKVIIAFGKGGFKWGWRIALFTGSAFFTANCVNVFMGHSSVLEYSMAGLVAGSLYKIGHGLNGFIVGGILGLVMGTIGGVLAMTILYLSGVTMVEIKQSFMKLVRTREDFKERYYEDNTREKEKVLTKVHEEMMGEYLADSLTEINEPVSQEEKV